MDKEMNMIDQFFEESLKDYTIQPSEGAKAAFLKEAAEMTEGKVNYRKWTIYLSSLVILLLTGSAYFFAKSPASSAEKSNIPIELGQSAHAEHLVNGSTPATLSATNQPAPSSFPENSSNATSEKRNIVVTNSQPESTKPTTHFRNKNQTTAPLNDKSQTTLMTNEAPVLPSKENDLQKSNEAVKSTEQSQTTTQTTSVQVDTILQEEEKEEVKPIPATPKPSPPSDEAKQRTPRSNAHVLFATGLYYTPEWMFNLIEPNKYVNNFGMDQTFYFGNYSIRTGLGLSITKGTNEIAIEYNDYLGSYKKLDSITFKFDAGQNSLVPTYFLTDTDVWDSIMKLEDAKVIKRYTYLQIPVILGYDFWKTEKVSLGVRTGPILSILLSSKQLSNNYDPGQDKVISINQITPERISTNWQFLVGLNFGVTLSHRLGFEIEPDARYYFNSVYEKGASNDKPWSVGFRAALILKY